MEKQQQQTRESSDPLPEIRRGRIKRLDIYDVSESELKILVRGAPDSIYLNFGIFLLSASLSFLVTLVTTTIPSDRLHAVLVILVVVGFISAAVLLTLWFSNRRSVKSLAAEIRSRLPPEGQPATLVEGADPAAQAD